MDESNDVTDTAQLLIFVRGIDDDFNVTEELASLESMHKQTTGKNIFKRIVACRKSWIGQGSFVWNNNRWYA